MKASMAWRNCRTEVKLAPARLLRARLTLRGLAPRGDHGLDLIRRDVANTAGRTLGGQEHRTSGRIAAIANVNRIPVTATITV